MIPNSAQSRLSVYGRRPRLIQSGDRDIISAGRHASIDVGYLEVSRELIETLGKRPCTLDRADLKSRDRSQDLTMVVGLPTDPKFMRVDTPSREIRAALIAYSNTAYSPQESKSLTGLQSPYRPRTDILFPYDQGDFRIVEYDSPGYLPEPYGFSGGGLWGYGRKTGRLWSPDMARIFAIDSSWDPRNSIIRAVKIVHWLRLICSEFADIRDEIASAFPLARFGEAH